MMKCSKCKTEVIKERWYMKFERLLNRVKKQGEELARSSLSVEDKAEIWEFFRSFYSGIDEDLEKEYPELKTQQSFRKNSAEPLTAKGGRGYE